MCTPLSGLELSHLRVLVHTKCKNRKLLEEIGFMERASARRKFVLHMCTDGGLSKSFILTVEKGDKVICFHLDSWFSYLCQLIFFGSYSLTE